MKELTTVSKEGKNGIVSSPQSASTHLTIILSASLVGESLLRPDHFFKKAFALYRELPLRKGPTTSMSELSSVRCMGTPSCL